MTAITNSQLCVYTIANRTLVLEALTHGGSGELTERRAWATGLRNLTVCMTNDQPYLLLLGDAATTQGVEWVAEVTRIELPSSGGTHVTFSGLRAMPRPLRLTRLRKQSNGEPLDMGYIRPYVPCLLEGKAWAEVRRAFATQLIGTAAPATREELARHAAEADMDALPDMAGVSATVRKALIDARVGQGAYRANVLKLWGSQCALTGCPLPAVLTASHAKPWHLCTHKERLDPYNGLLLASHVDKLLDAGLIAFADDGRLLRKPDVSDAVMTSLGLDPKGRLRRLHAKHQPYIAAHRTLFGFDGDNTDPEVMMKSTHARNVSI